MRQFGKQRLLHSWMMLALEANQVVGLRMLKLMAGGKRARGEAKLMVREKIDEAFKAGASLMAGASDEDIVRRYRRRVAANAKRLGKPNPSLTIKRRRRRRK
ncbi:hypothetical protein QA640_05645 [Bradyrhizobium sp. CB82]|uniref:hypothetical protein n=1 Tax=Bradyrhizobium sp. CB82 TaxID=3039159 RepID=UPI0024B113E0|nr:hypothetical protein [Bradyrhizobium sp. CB82]WFU41979.1 hypothetical protein QA640_05645 [Bradyrhizobium sp. CB82]